MTIAAPDTGQGATLVFTTSTFVANYTKITPKPLTRSKLETSNLSTTNYRTFSLEELVTAGGFTAEFFYDPKVQPPFSAAPETVTITNPVPPAGSTGSTCAGSAAVVSFTPGDLMIGAFMVGTIEVDWMGSVTFTAGT